MEYSLSFNKEEEIRLLEQAKLLGDPRLIALAARAKRCLELGSGTGANLSVLRAVKFDLDYLGIDVSEEAVAKAKAAFPNERFLVANAAADLTPLGCFELVFTRFVLWCMPGSLDETLAQISRVLTPGGAFCAYEPDDRYLALVAKDKGLGNAAMRLITKWQETTRKKGSEPFVGHMLPGAVRRSGLQLQEASYVMHTYASNDTGRLAQALANLRGIFTQKGPEYLGLAANDPLWLEGTKQLSDPAYWDVITEAYLSLVATKV